MRKNKIYRIISHGGLGDALLTTPAFKALKRQYPDSKVKVFCLDTGHKDIYYNNPYIDELNLMSFSDVPIENFLYYFKIRQYYHNNYGLCSPSKIYNIHASKIIAEMLDVEIADEDLQIFLTKEEEKAAQKLISVFKNPIIIHITSIASTNQHWPLENWEKLINLLPDYTFIQLGNLTESKVNGAVDLRGKTSIREAIALLKYAKSFLGVVSSFAHATSAVMTPGVVLYGPSTPVIWGHKNNINIFKGVPCSPCIDDLLYVKCPYSLECMNSISVEEVKNAILIQVNMRRV